MLRPSVIATTQKIINTAFRESLSPSVFNKDSLVDSNLSSATSDPNIPLLCEKMSAAAEAAASESGIVSEPYIEAKGSLPKWTSSEGLCLTMGDRPPPKPEDVPVSESSHPASGPQEGQERASPKELTRRENHPADSSTRAGSLPNFSRPLGIARGSSKVSHAPPAQVRSERRHSSMLIGSYRFLQGAFVCQAVDNVDNALEQQQGVEEGSNEERMEDKQSAKRYNDHRPGGDRSARKGMSCLSCGLM